MVFGPWSGSPDEQRPVFRRYLGGALIEMTMPTIGAHSALFAALQLRRRQILNSNAVAILDDLRDPSPMAVQVIALVTEDADRSRFPDQRGQLVEFFPGLHRLQMRRVDAM